MHSKKEPFKAQSKAMDYNIIEYEKLIDVFWLHIATNL